jgi:hypothetical protein
VVSRLVPQGARTRFGSSFGATVVCWLYAGAEVQMASPHSPTSLPQRVVDRARKASKSAAIDNAAR